MAFALDIGGEVQTSEDMKGYVVWKASMIKFDFEQIEGNDSITSVELELRDCTDKDNKNHFPTSDTSSYAADRFKQMKCIADPEAIKL